MGARLGQLRGAGGKTTPVMDKSEDVVGGAKRPPSEAVEMRDAAPEARQGGRSATDHNKAAGGVDRAPASTLSAAPAVSLCQLASADDVARLEGRNPAQLKVVATQVVCELARYRSRGLKVPEVTLEDGVILERPAQVRTLADDESTLLCVLMELVEARRVVLARIGKQSAAAAAGKPGYPDWLTVARIRAMRPGEILRDGGRIGLSVEARTSGLRCFSQRLRVAKTTEHPARRVDVGLGSFPGVSQARALKKVRRLAARNQKLGRKGVHPGKRAGSKAPSFREVAGAYFEQFGGRWKGRGSKAGRWSFFERFVFPEFGDKRIDAVTGPDVVRALLRPSAPDPRMTGSAAFARSALRSVFKWAVAERHVKQKDNPMLAEVVSDLEIIKGQPLPSCDYEDMPENYLKVHLLMQELATGAAPGGQRLVMAALALKTVMVTMLRSQAVTGGRWDELGVLKKLPVWTIPKERMKGKNKERLEPFPVPLTSAMKRVFEEVKKHGAEGPWMFGYCGKGGVVQHVTFHDVFDVREALGFVGKITSHGMRSTITEWGTDHDYVKQIIEIALAHAPKDDTERAYWRGKLVPKRQGMMEKFGRFVSSKVEVLMDGE